jgi:hypothetical protein
LLFLRQKVASLKIILFTELADLTAYLEADGRLLAVYAGRDEWTRRVVINVASSRGGQWFASTVATLLKREI